MVPTAACTPEVAKVRNHNPLVLPSSASAVIFVEEEQQEISITPAGTATEVRIGIVTPLETAPSSTGTFSRSTKALAASTPTLGST